MTTTFSNIFSTEDVNYLNQSPEVIEAKAKLEKLGVVYFTIPLTETIRNSLVTKFGLDLSNITHLPMRWIKGDTSPHIDVGPANFQNTYLAYINDNPGEFIIDNESYPITANTGFVFNEGLSHKTQNTGTEPRLLLGPMNERAESVGQMTTIFYYNNYDDYQVQNGNELGFQQNTWIIGDTANIIGSGIGNYTTWRIAYVYGGNIPTGVYSNGFDLSTLGFGSYTFYLYPAAPCFLEGTTVLCQVEGEEKYIPIETITKETLVKTSRDGYKKVHLIGNGDFANPGNDERVEDRLYKCSPSNYPELKEDLYITGCHSILEYTITDVQREHLTKRLGELYITDNKYRLLAYLDERAEPWNSDGLYKIWHIALENKDERKNYGIYVNGGLLVESCSINYLKFKSNMKIA
jgi:hypothetical protein